MFTEHTRRLEQLAVTAALGALCASGCGGSSGSALTPPPASAAPPAVIKTRVAPGSAKGFVGARADVTGLECVRHRKQWTVSGKVTNPTRRIVSYRIYTAFLDAGANTRGLLETDVRRVPAHRSRTWNNALTLNARSLHCVLRVERTPKRVNNQ
jgi:hypothetical protein